MSSGGGYRIRTLIGSSALSVSITCIMFNSPLLFVVLMFEGDGVRSEDRDFIPWPPLGRQQHKKLQLASAFFFFLPFHCASRHFQKPGKAEKSRSSALNVGWTKSEVSDQQHWHRPDQVRRLSSLKRTFLVIAVITLLLCLI